MRIVIELLSINPVHARLKVHATGKRYGFPTESLGDSGTLTVDTEIIPELITRIQPEEIWAAVDFGATPCKEADELVEWLNTHFTAEDSPQDQTEGK